MIASVKKPREVTGRAVLVWLVCFFGVVFVVNGVMIKAATSTFGGVETASSYKAGLMFKQEIAAAEQQDERHWKIDGTLKRNGAGEAVLDFTARDASGAPLTGLTADATLVHPADARLDHAIKVDRVGAGRFHGESAAPRGQWELLVDLYRDGDRVFRSRSRVSLQ
ncbi:nitrogen fixation protein FixH [Pseudolabrys taiwanensis]|uniref:Nitrogen fixation protein FixH n=1 Tax=Pseudolabrys taiwanensis TaxID=331696 RepID=A0A346A0Q1_9HYPH|nr:FixH family protein [Pseudolabrys taiwanensis]AXK82748.1 nitrogen fixation protein FixH [Pseudolabrys taiwanensis]